MKKILFDISFNKSNPYCGISNDTENIIRHIKNTLKINSFYLPGFLFSFNKLLGLIGIKKKLDTKKYDYLFCQTVNNFIASDNTRKIIRIHDLIPLTHPELTPKLSSILFRRNLAFNAQEKNVIFVCNSNTTKKILCQHYPQLKNRCFVSYCSSDLYNITPSLRGEKQRGNLVKEEDNFSRSPRSTNVSLAMTGLPAKFSLVVSALEPKKNLENFLFAWEQAIKKDKNLLPLVLVANEGWKNETTKALLLKLLKMYPDKIIHLKNISNHDLACLYETAEYFIMPSIVEGFGIPVLNALLFEKSMLISDIEVFHELADDAALFCNHKNKNDICKKLLEINNDSRLRKKLSAKAATKKEIFSDEKMKQQWQKILASI